MVVKLEKYASFFLNFFGDLLLPYSPGYFTLNEVSPNVNLCRGS